MVEKLRFAIVGLHNWYHAHPYAMAFRHVPGVELVAASHDDPIQLKEFVDRFGLKASSTEMAEVIGRRDVDAVIVNAYTAAHLELVKMACEKGKHVICDKPIEVSLERTREMARAVEKASVKFMIGNEFRTLPVFKKVAELVRGGIIGNIIHFSYAIHSSLPRKWMTDEEPGWYGDPAKVGHGGFFDFSVQQFDLLRFVLGKEALRVSGNMRNLLHRDLAVEDYGAAFTEFEGGAAGVVESSWITDHFTETFALRGTDGTITVEGPKITASAKSGKTEITAPPVVNEAFRAVPGVIEIPIGIWYHLLSAFVDSVRRDKSPPQTIHDGLKTIEFAMATYESSKKHRPVTIKELI